MSADRNAILARRQLLIGAALSAVACSSQGPGPTPPAASGRATSGQGDATTPTATSTPLGALPPRKPWSELNGVRPPLDVAASLSADERAQLEAQRQRIEAQYEALRTAWDGVPECSPSDPACRQRWRELGGLAKKFYDANRGPLVPGCGAGLGSTGSWSLRAQAHQRYLSELVQQFETYADAMAARHGLPESQEWLRLSSNAKQPPPMPCLSPCPPPEIYSSWANVTFEGTTAKDSERITLEFAKLFALNRSPARLIVRGHTNPRPDAEKVGLDRAQQIAARLIAAGVPAKSVVTRSMAATLLVERPDGLHAAANERVDFLVEAVK